MSAENQFETQPDEETSVEETTSTEESLSAEDIDNMSDEDFENFLATGEYKNSKEPEPEQSTTEEANEEKTTVVEEKNGKDEVSEEKPDPDNAKIISKPEKKEEPIDYESIYKSIFKPFKANGKEITPRNAEDVISLMQMGANYTKKMQELAPAKRAIASLRKANINDEEKLNFIIDAYKGDQEAIKKLLKDSKVDPMDLDLDETNYRANKQNIASEEDVQWNDTLSDISASLPKIDEIINKEWDATSKKRILKDPQLLRALHEEIQYGRYDEVQKLVDMEKTFGRYKGVPDIDIYTDIVNKLAKEQAEKSSQQQPEVEEKPTKKVPDKSKAAPTRSKHGSSKKSLTKEELFAMSDEDFAKISVQDLI